MFAGHIGAGLALAAAKRDVSVGMFVFAALLADTVLWILVLAGVESASIPPDFADTHQPRFDFPYSHGLLASFGWAALAAAIAAWWRRLSPHGARFGAALLIALAVFSHWVLDVVVHARELPLAGPASTKLGLALWNHMPFALTLEAAILAGGLVLYVRTAALTTARKAGIAVLALATLGFTIAGMTVAPAPPSIAAMAATSLATIVAVSALAGWLGAASRGGGG